jgi:outer membrane protein insertion porin family
MKELDVLSDKAGTNLIADIKFEGLRRLEVRTVMQWVFSQKGEIFSPTVLKGDLQRLKRSGYLTKVDVRLEFKQGLVFITFVVEERTGIIRAIYFVGSQNYTPEQLYGQIRMRPGMPFDRHLLAEDARTIIGIYNNIGYFRVHVSVQGRWVEQGLFLWFVIKENEVAQIRQVILQGNREVPSSQLLPLLDSQPSSVGMSLAGKGFYHPSFVARDLYFLRNYYFDHGYIQNRISGPKLRVSRDRLWVSLVYRIEEGPLFHYGVIVLGGDLIRTRAEMEKILTVRSGQVFNRTALYRDNILRLSRYYRDAGYAYVDVQTLPGIDPSRNLVHLQFVIRKGPLMRVERIEISGNTTTRDRVIRRRILIKEGDLYSETLLDRSRSAILAMGFFEPTDPSLGIKVTTQLGRQPDLVILTFEVKEKSTWLYNFGFNYLPLTGFVFAGQLGKTNFLGHGQTLLGGGLISSTLRLWRIFLLFVEPRLFDTDLWLSSSGYLSHSDLSSSFSSGFIRDSLGARLSLSYPLFRPDLRLQLSYRLERLATKPGGDRILNVPVANYFSEYTSSGFILSLQWDTRNSSVNPSRGWTLFASYEHVAPYFGANYSLHRWEAGARLFLPLPLSSTLRLATTAGWVISHDANGVPPFERFPLDQSFFLLRGFEPNSVGPMRQVPALGDAAFRTVPLNWGGSKKFLFNAEWIFPLLKVLQLNGVVFFDAGNAFDDHEWMFQDLRNNSLPLGLFMNVGLGLRWELPNIGVMRFEFGIPLTRRPFDPPVVFSFNVGESF